MIGGTADQVGGHRCGQQQKNDDGHGPDGRTQLIGCHGFRRQDEPRAQGSRLGGGVHANKGVRQPEHAHGSHQAKEAADDQQGGRDDGAQHLPPFWLRLARDAWRERSRNRAKATVPRKATRA